MKKNLLTLSALVLSLAATAQTVLCHVDKGSLVYVSKDALVYNGGGLQIKDTGKWENHGNVMLVGDNDDVFKTVDASGNPKIDGGNFINKVNSSSTDYDYTTVGTKNTYGQLYISQLTQANITGVVDQEYQREAHGDYQQVGLPFSKKNIITELSTDFGATFNDVRWSEKEILKWNNRKVRFDKISIGDLTAETKGYDYYVLGKNSGLDTTTLHTIKGVPYAEAPAETLQNAGLNIDFGAGGNTINWYQERYNTYLYDNFGVDNVAWSGNFGKNIYQFGNPYMTNIDLTWIGNGETATVTDGNNLSNIYGVRIDAVSVSYNSTTGTEDTASQVDQKYITYGAGAPTGDVKYGIIRPMGVFVVKLKDNTNQTLDFSKLRRFAYTKRNADVNYSVTASRNANNVGTVKQLGIIGLNAEGKEISRTYYVVHPNAITGFSANNPNSTQIKVDGNHFLGSFEEDINGGYDTNLMNEYGLYINEANENDFLGKNIKVVSFNPQVKSYKFEIRENASLVDDGTHALSQGIGFYYKGTDGLVKEAKQGEQISLSSYNNDKLEYDFYYGEPATHLDTDETVVTPSRTRVVYNPNIKNYIVMFDSNWKKADIKVYDMSGKLVISESNVNTSTDYEIKLQDDLKSGYVVDIVSDNGDKLTKKILKNN